MLRNQRARACEQSRETASNLGMAHQTRLPMMAKYMGGSETTCSETRTPRFTNKREEEDGIQFGKGLPNRTAHNGTTYGGFDTVGPETSLPGLTNKR